MLNGVIFLLNKSEIYMAENVSTKAVADFFRTSKENGNNIHTLEVIHNGEIKVKIAPKPYSCDFKAQLYSLSKTFTSTAIGLLVDDGVLSVDDKITDIFSDILPEKVSENLAAMTLKHVLSMNTGHKECHLHQIRNSEEPIKELLKFDIEYAPGTHFTYNNAATYMLSEIVTKYTGMTVFDFLNIRLFKTLEIEGLRWDAYPNGKSQGAVGVYASVDDIAKLGQLYLNKGMWNGRRVLSEKWVSGATACVSDTSMNGTPDWVAGYGYQIWRNERDGFRADGAMGQFSIVLPEKNAVVAIQSMSTDPQYDITAVYALIDALYSGGSDDAAEKVIESHTGVLEYKPINISGEAYKCAENEYGITLVSFKDEKDRVAMNFSNGEEIQHMYFGKSQYCDNEINIKCFRPTLDGLAGTDKVVHIHFAACCTGEDGTLRLHIRFLDTPQYIDFAARFDGGKMCFEHICGEEKTIKMMGEKI